MYFKSLLFITYLLSKLCKTLKNKDIDIYFSTCMVVISEFLMYDFRSSFIFSLK